MVFALAMQPSAQSYLSLFKPRIGLMVLIATAIGYLLGGAGRVIPAQLALLLLGTLLSCAGAACLNSYLERDLDARMPRTCLRPIPSGRVSPAHALAVGTLLCLAGTALLAWGVNLLTAFLALLTCFLYVLVYTPLKRVTWLNTCVGAIPGALPPMGGWAAATGDLGLGAFALFLILYIWQHPHFYAIAWMYREDYAQGGFKMLPVVDTPDGQRTFRQILIFSIALIPVSVLPAMSGILGAPYVVGACLGSALMFYAGLVASDSRTINDARKLLRCSLVFLPTLLVSIVIDSYF